MSFKIEQRGNEHTNYSSRKGEIPIAFAEHITGSTAASTDDWFRSPNNKVSSANFMVTKLGKIYQYVDIKNMSWCTGLTSGLKYASSNLVHEKYPVNPNKYTISIEHESIDGVLTDIQLEASIWLHRDVIRQVKQMYGNDIKVDREHIIGHNEVDSKRKFYCPSNMGDKIQKFPMNDIIDEINEVDENEPTPWAKEAWNWGIENKITADGIRPKDNITREETMQFIYNFYNNVVDETL